jgi:N,N'-diacetyllegionaminate synthase
MKSSFYIGAQRIANDSRCFVIAEAGVNHNGEVRLAHELVNVAADAGADAIKFQTFNADRLVSVGLPKARYQIENTSAAGSQGDMLKELELTPEEFQSLADHSRRRDIVFISTPFDEQSADELLSIGVPAFKVSSGDLTNQGLLQHLAATKKPIIISTGMSYLGEVEDAVRCLEEAKADAVAILQCTSNYPAPPEAINLRVMETLRMAFGVPVGYSDHTIGTPVALASVARGAAILEKHFTLDRNLPGPDHKASIEPNELVALVEGIRDIETALGGTRKVPEAAEQETRIVARRSLFLRRSVGLGAIVQERDLIALRPGSGLSPMEIARIAGRRARRAMEAGQMVEISDVE